MSRITVESLAFNYPPHRGLMVFEDIDLAVAAGEVVFLLGPNGTGKSTLLKCMCGLLTPRRGRVLLEGRPMSRLGPRRIARRIGYVPQAHFAAFPFQVQDIVLMGRSPHLGPLAAPSRRDREVAEEAMVRVGIAGLAARPCQQLSGGEWQLVLIARALAQEPQILILDEPTSHLDLGNQMRILELVRGLAEQSYTIVLASHFPDHAFLTSGRVAILKGRRIVSLGRPEEVITPAALREVYGVETRIVTLDGLGRRRACVPLLNNEGPAGAARGL